MFIRNIEGSYLLFQTQKTSEYIGGFLVVNHLVVHIIVKSTSFFELSLVP
jgi:hypothetical protein